MNPDTLKVLEMVAEGTISPDDANALLKALGEGDNPPAPPPEATRRPVRENISPSTRLSIQQIARLTEQGVDADYIRELQAAGYGGLDANQIIELHNHGVDGDYIRELREVGFVGQSPHEL